MKTATTISGKRIERVLARALPNGYLEIVVVTDSGTFNVFRYGIVSRPDNATTDADFVVQHSECSEQLIDEAWSDGDTLVLTLRNGCGFIYEFIPPDATGLAEEFRLVHDRDELSRLLRYIREDPDAQRF